MLWRLLPITTLTVRQFTGGRTARLVLFLSCLPALFAAIFAFRPAGVPAQEFLSDLFRELIVPTLAPIVVLLPATGAFGDELEDGTLPYLVMKPVSRLTRAETMLDSMLEFRSVGRPQARLGHDPVAKADPSACISAWSRCHVAIVAKGLNPQRNPILAALGRAAIDAAFRVAPDGLVPAVLAGRLAFEPVAPPLQFRDHLSW